MDAQQDVPMGELPSETVFPSDSKKLSETIVNATDTMTDDANAPIDIDQLIDDWTHLSNLPSFYSVLHFFTSIAHAVVNWIVSYSLWSLVYTLAVLEAPQVVMPAQAPWTSKKDDGDESQPPVKQERQITSSIRTTVRHLYRVGGVLGPFRGLACKCCQWIAVMVAAIPIGVFYSFPTPGRQEAAEVPDTLIGLFKTILVFGLGDFVAKVCFISWSTAWVHIIITQPTLRIWYRRLPPFLPTLRATWRPIALHGLAQSLILAVVPVLLKHPFDLNNSEPGALREGLTSEHITRTLIWLVTRSIGYTVRIPLDMALTRIQASMLPEEEETIIPFDRSFNSNGTDGLKPGLLAEPRGTLSFREAWQSVSWSEVRRIVVLCVKMLVAQAVMNGAFSIIIGGDAWSSSWKPWVS